MCDECNGNYRNCPVCGVDELEEEVCPDCEGVKTFVSDCCGAQIIFHDRCSNCMDNCGAEEEVCDTCKGKGVILVEIEND
jgi:hypothetical protein